MELTAQKRTAFGKKTNALRKSGLVPGEVYGHGMENIHVSVSDKEFAKLWKQAGENTIVSLKIDKDVMPVLIADVSFDPLTHNPHAVDFRRVQKGEKIHVYVPIVRTGESPAEKEGLNVMQILAELEIETVPSDIPHEFQIDISSLAEAGQSIAVKDISLPKTVKALLDDHTVIFTVTEPQKEEETPPPATETESEAEKPATDEDSTEKAP
jgi:large subunit ribosomal protein L25